MIIPKKEKKFYTSYSKLSEVKLITIGLASPERIKQWAEKTLPNGKILGEVINANTLHHKTFKPQKGGLFCERIFGPLKDFECACGKPQKYKKNSPLNESFSLNPNETNSSFTPSIDLNNSPNKSILGGVLPKTRNFCTTCEVEYTWSVMRRYQLGYIKLVSPVTHVWYLKGNPSYLSILLDIKKRHLEYITYCSETLTIENALKGGKTSSKSSDIVSSWNKLKQQILIDKTTNANDTSKSKAKSKLITSQTKIEKRKKIKLKKIKPWKKFYNKNAIHTPMVKINTELKKETTAKNLNSNFIDWYNFLIKPTIQLKSLNQLGFKENNSSFISSISEVIDNSDLTNLVNLATRKEMKIYANQLNLKKLITLSILINQAKTKTLTNNFLSQTVKYQNGSIKDIYKKISIPFYILLSLNKSKKNNLPKSSRDKVWRKLTEKSLKKALVRVTKIYNKLDSLAFKQTWLDVLTNIQTLNLREKTKTSQINQTIKLNLKNQIDLDLTHSLNDLLYQIPFQTKTFDESLNSVRLNEEDESKQESLTKIGVDLTSFRDCIQFLKNNFYNLLNETNNIKLSAQINSNENFSSELKLGKTNETFLMENFVYLEFYTMSNCPSDFVNYLISENLIQRTLNIKTLQKNYKVILKNLTEIFFFILLKNSNAALKNIAFNKSVIIPRDMTLKPSANADSLVKKNQIFFGNQFLKNPTTNRNAGNNQNKVVILKKNLKEFQTALNIFHSVGINPAKTKNIFKKLPETLTTVQPKKLNPHIFDPENKMTQSNLNALNNLNNDVLTTFKNKHETDPVGKPAKKLFNNIYSLSHRERWEVENDWNFLYYFMTAPSLDSHLIPNYKNRYENGYGTNVTSNEYDATLTYQNISLSLQKSAFFSGPGIVQQLLTEFNFYEIKKMDKQNRILLYQLNKQIFKLKKYSKHDRSAKKELKESYKKRDLLIRRTKLVRKLFIKESAPQATILTVLPVLPPDLRPIVKMGGQIAASDLNRLYQRVIYRNDRLKKFLKDPATSHSYEMKYAQRLLQEAVDNLIQNGKSGVVSEKDSRGRALKSLSDILKGKQGRFRQYLLGKRVDYSGRSVIVVGPKLKLHECGLPKEMALELYLPFLLKRILNENLAKTVVGAKTLIKTNPALIWELLREIMQTCPVILNRAPTLHRLGIQSFQPKLIDGRAILLHPLVCSAFNADFDGDQMAVHVPITVEARAEAWKLMLSRNNILSPATGDPLAIPSQDMVLGCYYLTTNLLNSKTIAFLPKRGSGYYFSSIQDALKKYELNKIDLHSNIWLKWDGLVENGSDQEQPIEIRIDTYGNWKEIYNKSQKNYNSKNTCYAQYILTTPGKILFNQIIHLCLN